MASVIPVRFAYAARDLWFDPGQTGAQEGDHVICSTERGTEIGLATDDAREVSNAELNRKTGNAALKPVLRVAGDEDLARAEELAQLGDEAMPTFRRLVSDAGLDMKPVGVEYLFGRERVVCYFAADERVDFRALVRNLSHELHERIDMRQIGVREEAAVVGGYGHCGQELCCARIGLSFEPVSIRMAKEQDLPLTSNKISGACGRLMCCLRYEFEAYRDFKGRAPKRNAVIDTPLGKAKIVEYDTPKEQIALRIESGKTVRIPLAEMVASEAAVKKSEELHCPCRPDTVVRESLDKLSSPDVQMALAELDRKMGVVKDDFEDDDIFVETKQRKRRNRRGAAQESEDATAKPEESTGTSRRRRRRRSGKGAGAAESGAAQQQDNAAGAGKAESSVSPDSTADKPARRRRRRRSGTGAQEATQAQASQPTTSQPTTSASADEASKDGKTRRRRRHRYASGESGGANAAGQGAQTTKDGQGTDVSQGQQRPKRRPGDRGGQAAQGQRGHGPEGQGQAGQRGASGQDAQQSAGESAPKRRRRRRGGRGRGGSGSGGNGGGNGSGNGGGNGSGGNGSGGGTDRA